MTDIGLNSLSESFKEIASLQEFDLNFAMYLKNLNVCDYFLARCGKITDEGFVKLSESFKDKIFLKSLQIGAQYCSSLNDTVLLSLGKALFSAIYLQRLSLDFST